MLYLPGSERPAMSAQSALEADADALDLAERMLEREDVRQDILEETLDSAEAGTVRESGRTICGASRTPLGPLSREFSAVTLPTCPATVGGTWHTHITRPQFLNPENSLPDFANVAFGIVDVSVVVGAESSHVVIGARDRKAMQDALAEEMGQPIRSPGDVARAVLDGEIGNPPAVRRRLYARLGEPIVYRADTAAPELAGRAQEVEFSMAAAREVFEAVEMSGCTLYAMLEPTEESGMERFIRQSREMNGLGGLFQVGAESDFNFRQQVLATTISVAVGNIVERALFG